VLLIETASIYARHVLSGISRYLKAHQQWLLFIREYGGVEEPLPRWLRTWRGDGLICRLRLTSHWVEHLRRLKVPLVNLDDFHSHPWLPLIRSDDAAIGRLAAEHLLERCFRHFAFCGFRDLEWSRQRREGFRNALSGGGTFCGVYESTWNSCRSCSWEREQEDIERWLQSLPKPVGILAGNDGRGRHVVDACRRANLAVPEDVAVIGVDDDALLCQLCNPPLSSVIPDPERIGYEAAALLDRLMGGGRPPLRQWLIPPLGVAARQSTDVLAIDDPELTTAVRYIREHACQGITVQGVLKQVHLSRTLLERKFRKYLGHSPQADIRAVQLRRVQQLLTQTHLPLDRIAAQTGYKYAEYMSVAFKRATAQTPGHYRRQAQSAMHQQT
jgi:LacI family transcriptional regulator